MTRPSPTPKETTIWLADGRWFQNRGAAYYAIAKRLVINKYPRWLQDHDLDEAQAMDITPGTIGDLHASYEGIADWRRRREKMRTLFVTQVPSTYEDAGGEYFDTDRWKRVVTRVARFLMFVDRRRAEIERAASYRRAVVREGFVDAEGAA